MGKGSLDISLVRQSHLNGRMRCISHMGSRELHGYGIVGQFSEPNICKTYLFSSLAKEILDVAAKTYSDVGNLAQILEIRTQICEIKQGRQSMTKYCSVLKGLWQE